MQAPAFFKKYFPSKSNSIAGVETYELYTSCEILSLSNFISCLCDDNYKALIIYGKPSVNVLFDAWVGILSEYYELTHESIFEVEHLRLRRDIIVLQNHLEILQYCIILLEVEYREVSAELIRKLGYRFKPALNEKNPALTDPAKYKDQLITIAAKSKRKHIEMEQARKQLMNLQAKAVMQKKPERKNFLQSIVQLEEMQGVNYDINIITVEKYISLTKKYQEKVDAVNALNSKRR